MDIGAMVVAAPRHVTPVGSRRSDHKLHALGERGDLIDPYTSFVIDGWRTGDDPVAAFRFSDMDRSYADRTGKPRNIGVIGVIGVAFFQEQGQVQDNERRRRDSADSFPNRC